MIKQANSLSLTKPVWLFQNLSLSFQHCDMLSLSLSLSLSLNVCVSLSLSLSKRLRLLLFCVYFLVSNKVVVCFSNIYIYIYTFLTYGFQVAFFLLLRFEVSSIGRTLNGVKWYWILPFLCLFYLHQHNKFYKQIKCPKWFFKKMND